MFGDYQRLESALLKNRLEQEWRDMLLNRVSNSWNGRDSAGYIPLRDYWAAKEACPEAFSSRGLYVWGAWTGTKARCQYVGIAHGFSLGKRMERRYVGSETHGTRRWTEMKFAGEHGSRLVTLADDFSPRRQVNIAKFRDAGIPLPSKGLYRRLVRAERYAKNGLENAWCYLIPAPPERSKQDLAAVESELIALNNAVLFKLSVDRSENAVPLLNVVHATSRTNRYVDSAYEQSFNGWIDGNWWKRPYVT